MNKPARLQSIDFLRGLVMVIMALDHARDLLHVDALTQDPTNLSTTTPVLFGTRWITHLCAPTFVFLSGVSAFLSYRQQGDLAATRRFLWTRGVWLIFLDYTFINFSIWYDPLFRIVMSQVIAAIGFGFVALSLLLRFSARTVGLLGLTIVLGHNLLAHVNFPPGTALNVVWGILFKLSFFQATPNFAILVNYPLIPWLGILLAGYGCGLVFLQNDEKRRKTVLLTGLGMLGLFVALRTFNAYGDPAHWSFQKDGLFSFLSFINLTKYPPSLLYVCATLGLSFLVLRWVEGRDNVFTRAITVYGKVPLFYYLLHWNVLHLLMLGMVLAQGFAWSELNFGPFGFGRPAQGGGIGLGAVYLAWAAVVAALYVPCRWYGRYKAQHPEKWWLRYI
jgi:uncharacterized membrane protein